MTTPFERLKQSLVECYRIERELGQGGMATVYLAEDLKHRRKVALKVLRPELAAIIGAERFLKEIEVTANLQHPNILPLYDSGQADSFLYYVMPYVEGESLRDKLTREKQLGVEESVTLARAVAAAPGFAHRHGVVHRDIKPENILLQSGQALVADFGIALALSQAGGSRMTETGMSLGTPHYMSPEQATGDRTLDARSDVYALGCITYEMLAGEPPYLGNTAQAIVAKILTESPTPVRKRRPSVPAHIEAAIQMALAKLPADALAPAGQCGAAAGRPVRPGGRVRGGAFQRGLYPPGDDGAREPGSGRRTLEADGTGRIRAHGGAGGGAHLWTAPAFESSSGTGDPGDRGASRGGGDAAGALRAVRHLARRSPAGLCRPGGRRGA